jgi:hypothetical protein
MMSTRERAQDDALHEEYRQSVEKHGRGSREAKAALENWSNYRSARLLPVTCIGNTPDPRLVVS